MKQKLFLIVIVLLAFFLRIYQVGSIPPALSWDEVSIGYNAYSILKIGRDEHGRVMPVDTFVGYGDYKPPILVYLTAPTVAVFGLNEFAVRLPSVIFGTLTVLLTYFLVLALFPQSILLSLLSCLLLALAPWHIQLSRGGFEANIATFFIVLGVYLVLKARKDARFLVVCWLPFAAGVYTFNSSRYVGPLLCAGFFLYLLPVIRKQWKRAVAGIFLTLLCLAPIIPHMVSPEARLRFAEVNIFSDVSIVQKANERMAADTSVLGKIFHNRRVGYAREYLLHYVDHFEPWFLFIRGDGNPKFSIQDVGQLYLIEFPFLILGIFWMFRKDKGAAWLLVFWLLISIVPAAVARETPHALRIENSLPVWQLFIAYGIFQFIRGKKHTRLLSLALVVLLYAGNVSFYLHNYYSHYQTEYSGEWQYGYREAVRVARDNKDKYKKIVITETIGRPYMYTLFYEQYDPRAYLEQKKSWFDAAGFYHVSGFGPYEFVKEGVGTYEPNVLYILAPKDIPETAKIVETIKALNGKPVLVAFEL